MRVPKIKFVLRHDAPPPTLPATLLVPRVRARALLSEAGDSRASLSLLLLYTTVIVAAYLPDGPFAPLNDLAAHMQ
jgi:hypothetical protein